jgi:hypothetical protein
MDRHSRHIILALVGVLISIGLALVGALVIPFNVEQPVNILAVGGVVRVVMPGREPDIDLAAGTERVRLKLDHSLRLEPGGTAVVSLFKHARAAITGPAEFTVLEAHRRATALGHILDSDSYSREYVLTIRQ